MDLKYISGGKWVPMTGNLPNCGNVPMVSHQRLNSISIWGGMTDTEFLLLFLMAEALKIHLVFYESKKEEKYFTFYSSHVTPLRKYDPINVVNFLNKSKRPSLSAI